MYDFVGAQQAAMGNLTNAIAGYRQRQDEEARLQAEAEAQRQKQKALQQQNGFENEMALRKTTLDEQRFDEEQQLNALRQREMQGGIEKQGLENEVEKLKFFHGVSATVKDQATLDAGRQTVARFDPKAAAEMPEKWDDNAKKLFNDRAQAIGGALKDKYKHKEYWLENEETGEKTPHWAREGESVDASALPPGLRFSTAPNDDEKIENIRRQTALDKQKLQNQTEMQKKRMDIEARRAKEKEELKSKNFKDELDLSKYHQGLSSTKNWNVISPQFANLEATMAELESQGLSKDPEALGAVDKAVITILNTALQPGSVVQPSEFATTGEDMSYIEKAKALYDHVIKGGRLSDIERESIFRLVGNFKDAAKRKYDEDTSWIAQIAEKNGFDPTRVINYKTAGLKEETEQQSSKTTKPKQPYPLGDFYAKYEGK